MNLQSQIEDPNFVSQLEIASLESERENDKHRRLSTERMNQLCYEGDVTSEFSSVSEICNGLDGRKALVSFGLGSK